MAKCGKGCMPECEYFTTGGCISPFNCPYKIEEGYINSATSFPTYMEQYNGMSNDDIERCLERLSTCKATDVMNFDYSGTLAYIKRLKAENANLHKRLKETAHRAEVAERALQIACKDIIKMSGDNFFHNEERIIEIILEQAEKELAEGKKE